MSVTENTSSTSGQALSIDGLTMHFPAHGRGQFVHALDDLRFAVERGRILAIVGESGSGKSTAARLISLIHSPTGGTVRIDGVDATALRGRRLRRFRRRVQMVFQDPFGSMNPAHPAHRQIDRALRLHTSLRGDALVKRRRELLASVELTPPERFEGRYPHELSGGQRQRINIAAALAADPDVLLADEPVSMLDVSIRAGVLRLLDRLRAERGIAIVFVTHDLASAQELADDTLVLYAGQSMEQGATDEVINSPLHPYTRLLLSAVPAPEKRGQRIEARGEVPTIVNPRPGCRFAARCPIATDICTQQDPDVVVVDTARGRRVRCHAYDPAQASHFPELAQ
ncbi:ABC transporter ATP-binding protein [Microbacterium sp.]|uniref:ABC transporter ATP-binding protein n=1 Tax=Microbacterium sp. TaxID=51671 RepID=UPI003F70B5CD